VASLASRFSCPTREPRSAALAVGALALKDVGAVCPVLLTAVSATQDINVLVVVRADKVRGASHDLLVSVGVARFGRPFAHDAQYAHAWVSGIRSLGS
jgi:hypothetical protein